MKRVEIRLLKKICVFCHERRARYQYRGRVRWNRQHCLCFRCFRSCSDRLRTTFAVAAEAITHGAESTFGANPDPMLVGLERGAYAVSTPLPPYAGAAELAATAGTAQDALLGGNL